MINVFNRERQDGYTIRLVNGNYHYQPKCCNSDGRTLISNT